MCNNNGPKRRNEVIEGENKLMEILSEFHDINDYHELIARILYPGTRPILKIFPRSLILMKFTLILNMISRNPMMSVQWTLSTTRGCSVFY